MKWDRLRLFNIVAQTRNITEASYILHVSQSALSRQMKALENELGVKLFLRNSDGEEYLIEGKLPDFNQKRTRDVLLSKTLMNRLQLSLNDTINVTFFKNERSKLPSNRKLVITGIYNTGFLEFDKNMMIGDIRQVQGLNKWNENQVGGFEILLENFDDLPKKGKEIYQEIDATLDAQTIISSYPAIFEWIQLFDNNIWFIIIIMILVAGINMITALLVLILERVQMVGILKAMGSSNWSIRKIFLYNASYLIFVGLFWGNIIGLTLLLSQKYFVHQLKPMVKYHLPLCRW